MHEAIQLWLFFLDSRRWTLLRVIETDRVLILDLHREG
jgi:hypothetical protein